MTAMTASTPIEYAIAEWLTTTEIKSSGIYTPSEEMRELCNSCLSFFSFSINSISNVSTIEDVSFVHVGTYFSIIRQLMESGQWNAIVRSVENTPQYHPQPDEYDGLLELQADILKRFFAFCWSREYIGDHFLSWVWTQTEFKKAATLRDAYVLRRVGRA